MRVHPKWAMHLPFSRTPSVRVMTLVRAIWVARHHSLCNGPISARRQISPGQINQLPLPGLPHAYLVTLSYEVELESSADCDYTVDVLFHGWQAPVALVVPGRVLVGDHLLRPHVCLGEHGQLRRDRETECE